MIETFERDITAQPDESTEAFTARIAELVRRLQSYATVRVVTLRLTPDRRVLTIAVEQDRAES